MKSYKAQVRFTLQRLTAQTSHSMTHQILTTQDFTPINDEELMAVKGDNAAAVIGWGALNGFTFGLPVLVDYLTGYKVTQAVEDVWQKMRMTLS